MDGVVTCCLFGMLLLGVIGLVPVVSGLVLLAVNVVWRTLIPIRDREMLMTIGASALGIGRLFEQGGASCGKLVIASNVC